MKKNKWFEFTPPKQGSAALEIQEVLPKTVKVVSSYHNVSARKLAKIELNLDYDVVVCGDDDAAKRTVMELTEIKNLRPLDGGGSCILIYDRITDTFPYQPCYAKWSL